MRHKEAVAAACIDMAHHDEEARMLQVHVGIGVHYWVIAHLHIGVSIVLNGELAYCRAVVQAFVFGEEACVGSQVDCKHLGNFAMQVKI